LKILSLFLLFRDGHYDEVNYKWGRENGSEPGLPGVALMYQIFKSSAKKS